MFDPETTTPEELDALIQQAIRDGREDVALALIKADMDIISL